jgi:predicted nucleic acid-binding protein
MDYAFDTNTIIHLMSGTQSVHDNRDKAKSGGANFFIPPFVNYEILRGLYIKPIPKHERLYDMLLNNCTLGETTLETWKQAARIYAGLHKKHFTVRDSDIIIAAYCIEHGCTLITNNTKDFINIDGLQLVDWTQE